MSKTKPAPKKRGRPPKPKQPILPGAEVGMPPAIAEIDAAADRYCDNRDERMDMLKLEVEARNALAALMKQHKLTEYRYDGKIVNLKATEEKLSVKRIPGTNGEADVEGS